MPSFPLPPRADVRHVGGGGAAGQVLAAAHGGGHGRGPAAGPQRGAPGARESTAPSRRAGVASCLAGAPRFWPPAVCQVVRAPAASTQRGSRGAPGARESSASSRRAGVCSVSLGCGFQDPQPPVRGRQVVRGRATWKKAHGACRARQSSSPRLLLGAGACTQVAYLARACCLLLMAAATDGAC